MDGLADTDIGSAAAEIIDIAVDVLVTGLRMFFQKVHGGHDHSGLAITTLGNILFKPRLLYRVQLFITAGEPLDGDNRFSLHAGQRGRATEPGIAIDMQGTGAAAADTASVFLTGELKVVPEHPQQGCVRCFINLNGFVVDAERNHAAGPLRIS